MRSESNRGVEFGSVARASGRVSGCAGAVLGESPSVGEQASTSDMVCAWGEQARVTVSRLIEGDAAGIEANNSCLKRAYARARCTWKGLLHVEAYVW